MYDSDATMSAMASQQKTSKIRVTGLSEGNAQVTGGCPSQRVSNVENVSIG